MIWSGRQACSVVLTSSWLLWKIPDCVFEMHHLESSICGHVMSRCWLEARRVHHTNSSLLCSVLLFCSAPGCHVTFYTPKAIRWRSHIWLEIQIGYRSIPFWAFAKHVLVGQFFWDKSPWHHIFLPSCTHHCHSFSFLDKPGVFLFFVLREFSNFTQLTCQTCYSRLLLSGLC